MNEEYEKIPMPDKTSPSEIASFAYAVLDAKKARDVRVIEVADRTVIADDFVIATANSSTHMNALADELAFRLKEAGVPVRVEGANGRSWIILDCDNVIIHLFTPDAREFYRLDRMWSDEK